MSKIKKVPFFVGHRGSRGVGVENTIEAFKEGKRRGYQALECDVRVTKDGEFIVFHDETLLRLGNIDRLISHLTYSELKSVRLTQVVNSKVLQGNIFSLEEFLEFCQINKIKPIIELKWSIGINNNDNSNVDRLIDLIKIKGLYHSCIILTSMKNTLIYLRNKYPDINLQLLVGGNIGITKDNLEFAFLNNISLDVEQKLVTKELVEMAHSHKLIVNSWTVNNQDVANRLLSFHVDMITTDDLK